MHIVESQPNTVESSKTDSAGYVDSATSPLSIGSPLVEKAIGALIRHTHKRNEATRTSHSLITPENNETVTLVFALKKIPEVVKAAPIPIALPYPIYDGNVDICVIVKDPQRKWKDLFAKESLSSVQKVISISKLKKKFNAYKDKRALCSAFDLFYCDDRIVHRMPSILGKVFISNKKLPIGLKIREADVISPVRQALQSTWMQIRCGPTLAVKIGRANMPVSEMVQNAMAVIKAVYWFYTNDSKWRNTIVSVSVQATDTIALPLYNAPTLMEKLSDVPKEASNPNIRTKNKVLKEKTEKQKKIAKRGTAVKALKPKEPNKRVDVAHSKQRKEKRRFFKA